MSTAAVKKNDLIVYLLYRIVPVQILVVIVNSVNSILDGVIAGRTIGPTAMAVIGLFYSFLNILQAVGSVLLGGASVLCNQAIGSGEMKKTEGIFSLSMLLGFVFGLVCAIFSFFFAGTLADILGASAELRGQVIQYCQGFAFGIVPTMICVQMSSFLQMERQNTRNYIGILSMAAVNASLDLLFILVFNMGVFGLALATSIGNFVYFCILVSYYFTKKAQLKFNFNNILWSETFNIIRIGSPGALLPLCLAFRTMILNRLLMNYGGSDALSALSSYNMANGIFIAFPLGIGMAVRMLGSLFVGEEDRDSLKHLINVSFSRGIPIIAAITLIMTLGSSLLAGIFFTDPASNSFQIARFLFLINGAAYILILFCLIFTNYMQAFALNLYVNIHSLCDGLVFPAICCTMLGSMFGLYGVLWGIVAALAMSAILIPILSIAVNRGIPKKIDQWLFIKDGFGVFDENRLEYNITSVEEVTKTAELVQDFCQKHNVDKKTSYFSALCLEEMAANIVQHGFNKDKRKNHVVSVRVVYREKDILLRLKDDCIPFNPQERLEQIDSSDPMKNFGIKTVYNIADDVNYQNVYGLNVLSIVLNNQ